MRLFLDDFIFSLSRKQQRRVNAVLEDAKIDKSQLSRIVDKLSNDFTFANVVFAPPEQYDLIDASEFDQNFREAFLALRDMYSVSNDVSLLLDSLTSIHTSDIASLENELKALEKSIDNYAFLLADAKAYDYAYIESFSDARGFDWLATVPDRADANFRSDEFAAVNASEGMLAIPPELSSSYPLSGAIWKSNVSNFVTSDTGIKNALNNINSTGWRVSIKSPAPINATLDEFIGYYDKAAILLDELRSDLNNFPGALVILEFTLDSPAPCDTIKVVPFADTTFEISQIVVYSGDDEESAKPILASEKTITAPYSFYFPLQPVTKFKLLLRQPMYRRTSDVGIASEEFYRILLQEVQGNANKQQLERSFMQRMSILLTYANGPNPAVSNAYKRSLPRVTFTAEEGAMTLENLLATQLRARTTSKTWTNESASTQTITKILRDALFQSGTYLFGTMPSRQGPAGDATSDPAITSRSAFGNETTRGIGNETITPIGGAVNGGAQTTPHPDPYAPVIIPGYGYEKIFNPALEKDFSYEYNLGIRSVAIGTGVKGFKGVFVSRQVPAPGDIGEIRIKVKDLNFSKLGTSRDSALVTSSEYSVTNISHPIREADWLPILPVDEAQIKGERFFPDVNGKGYLRFSASLEGSIILYKNGFLVGLDSERMLIRSSDKQSVVGLKLPQGEYTSQDIFTCDYTPLGDASTVNFERAGFAQVPLVSSFDENGAGEGFTSTDGQLTLTLDFYPYIDYNKVTTSSYSTLFGLNPYNPVSIRLNDGRLALNFTNYKGGSQSILNADSSDYQFLHTGNTIVFNKAIDQGFRVFYQYLPSNVRIRTVLRANDRDFVSPKVDYIQLKAKTRKADAKNNM